MFKFTTILMKKMEKALKLKHIVRGELRQKWMIPCSTWLLKKITLFPTSISHTSGRFLKILKIILSLKSPGKKVARFFFLRLNLNRFLFDTNNENINSCVHFLLLKNLAFCLEIYCLENFDIVTLPFFISFLCLYFMRLYSYLPLSFTINCS